MVHRERNGHVVVKALQSHHNPDKSLSDHISEVETAANAIFARHSEEFSEQLRQLVRYAAAFHDLGKASKQFQQYIADPKHYSSPAETKAHAPMSLMWWLAYALENGLSWPVVTSVAAAVWQHHGDFPAYEGPRGLEYALGSYEFILPGQLQGYPTERVAKELGIHLPCVADWTDVDLKAADFFYQQAPSDMAMQQAAEFRLRTQFLLSVILQADRALLALHGKAVEAYLRADMPALPSGSVVDEFCAAKTETPLSKTQTRIRQEVIAAAAAPANTVTLPTGLGKTLIGAEWLLQHRRSPAFSRKCIIVLPYLSIIDQTAKEYRALLGPENQAYIQEAHSLADRCYVHSDASDANSEEVERTNRGIDFLAETWNNEVIITTFDQFLASLFSSPGRHLIRSHWLADALIVMDEIQAVPPILWAPLREALRALTEVFNARTLVMSATQPGFLTNAEEAVLNAPAVFAERRRYALQLRHRQDVDLDSFCQQCAARVEEEWQGKRVMIVLNTRRSARKVRDAVVKHASNMPVHFLSADVIPQERLELVEQIKQNGSCIVVATQCIEAGVDVDLELVIRDFAPLDSIIQVAGRCNRRGLIERGMVELVNLRSEKGRSFANMIYDSILLENTAAVLDGMEELHEEDIYPVTTAYFDRIRTRKDLGSKLLRQWICWEKPIDLAASLGKDRKKLEFVVVSEERIEPGELPLSEALEAVLDTDNRWKRQRRIRELAPRIARLTVSVWSKPSFNPFEISRQLGPWLLLNAGLYERGKGLVLDDKGFANAGSYIF